MLKVLIAEDEPKTRRRIINLIEWEAQGFCLSGEARDGRMAIDMAEQERPDIIVTDICMPYLSGLELIQAVKQSLPNCMIILVTGYDKFEYAYSAIKLKVFDFILKPIVKEQLNQTLKRAAQELKQNKVNDWANRRIETDFPIVKSSFLKEWMTGLLPDAEVERQLEMFGLEIRSRTGILMVELAKKLEEIDGQPGGGAPAAAEEQLRLLFDQRQPSVVFLDDKRRVTVFAPFYGIEEWLKLVEAVKERVHACGLQGRVGYEIVENGFRGIPGAYQEIESWLESEKASAPIVNYLKDYLKEHYSQNDLSLRTVCDEFNLSKAYVCKLFKEQLGMTLTEYLTSIRISKAIELFRNPFLRIYEISERVGFSSQHYFSLTFKRVTGMSPIEYIEKNLNGKNVPEA